MPRKLLLFIVLAVVFCGMAEMALRFSGVIDFPLFRADGAIGYLPVPNQHGNFFNNRQWVFNDISMESAKWRPRDIYDLLVIGGSAVWGGTELAQPSKLGAQIEQDLTGWRVWSVSAENWSFANQFGYLDRHPEVLAETDVLVWIVSTSDMSGLSKWSSEDTQPQSRPLSALVYAVRKYVLPRLWKSEAASNSLSRSTSIDPVTEKLFREHYAELLHAKPDRKILFVLFPKKDELKPASAASEAAYNMFRDRFRADLGPQADILEARNDPRWKASLYRSEDQLTAVGNAVLADLIASHLKLEPPDFQ